MNNTMLAAVLHGAKDIRVESRAVPGLAPGMVLLSVRCTGICGSDSHYFEHGYCGPFVPTRPFILGHELTADVLAVGEGVTRPTVGARVTVNPPRACGTCEYCKGGRPNLCRGTIMLGSASTTPPTDGALAEYVTVRADQCHELPGEIDDGSGAMMEPLAVALHAVKRAGSVSGKRVLVMGGGPIGLLVGMTARAFGAAPVALSDIVDARRKTALDLGADVALDPAANTLLEQVKDLTGDGFEVIFEASERVDLALFGLGHLPEPRLPSRPGAAGRDHRADRHARHGGCALAGESVDGPGNPVGRQLSLRQRV